MSKLLINVFGGYYRGPVLTLDLSSLSTLSLGCCFAYLTYKGDRKWMRFSLLGRALGALVFARAGGALQAVAYWEGGMGVLAALVLWSG